MQRVQESPVVPAAELPVARFIEINAHGMVQYHFMTENDAKQFLDGLQGLLGAQLFADNKVERISIVSDFKLKAEYVVKVSPDQFDAWLGVGAYTKLCHVNMLSVKNKIEKMADALIKLEPGLANHAALLIDPKDGWSGLMVVVNELSGEQFRGFLKHLSDKTCTHAAVLQINGDRFNTLGTVARTMKSEEILQYILRLEPDICLDAALTPDKDDNFALSVILHKFSPEHKQEFINYIGKDRLVKELSTKIIGLYPSDVLRKISAAINHLDADELTLAMLETGSDGRFVLQQAIGSRALFASYMISMLLSVDVLIANIVKQDQQGTNTFVMLIDLAVKTKQFRLIERLLQKISKEACNQIALQQDKNGLSTLIQVAEKLPSQHCQTFMNHLTPQTWASAALQRVNNGPGLLETLARYQKDKFIDFVETMNAEACVHSAMMLNGDQSALMRIASSAGEIALFKLLGKIYQHPAAVKQFTDANSYLRSLDFYDRGNSVDAWSGLTSAVIDKAPAVKKRKAEADLSIQITESKRARPAWKPDFLLHTEKHGLKFLRLQGRTILLQDAQGTILAVKIQKKDETREELAKEYDTNCYLREHAAELGLKSALPTPLSISPVTNVIDWVKQHVPQEKLDKFASMTNAQGTRFAYIYKVDPKECDYFTYLHDATLSDEVYQTANRRVVHDLFKLLAHGVVFTQLGDIFHNSEHVNDRYDRGRYIVMVNLLRDGSGSGRLTGWKEAVEFPNVRASGLADLGDRASINDFIGHSQRVQEYYSEAWSTHREKAGNFLLANIMAEYQYVLFLVAGRRACDLTERAKKAEGKTAEEISANVKMIWQSIARQIVNNCALAVSTITHQPEQEVETFLLSIVDVNQLAMQMQYWMTDEYIPDLLNNKIKDGVYHPQVKVTVNIHAFRVGTFNEKTGCAIDGIHPDLGPVNGQEPLKKANELFYWMVNSVFQHYHQMRLTLQDVTSLSKATDVTEAEKLRAQAFRHLPEKSYHALQAALCSERLAQQQPLPEDLKEKIATERQDHKRKHAALTIGGFWRDKLSKRQSKKATIAPSGETAAFKPM